ncbi:MULTISPECIES: DUF4337 domain-containing protein [Leptospirillum]|jgi:hypothetical protein|nr:MULTISPECIES: DUF4337 domain-containing protein [Leptospirillum]EAY57214.1 MAG: conserved protein of unknown function [Leptospirillum rubarum]EIJ76845.1 MAG: uncharacterized protein C75L2_00690023 [Leptospirillum sp. Group II 'C75']AKS23759.1 hypothetical protein ABH19_08410 [Leptospirillum sp. Group II 'CF-1']OOH75129.1 hypothetical protein BOX24_00935 [Leptospirillum ferriphilum]OOH78755.1 hypothetical protein BOX30_07275 [Leptospirillum ferriphilum]
MGKESLEAHELIESVTESLDEREHKRDEWNIRVALTTSILAVLAALSNLESEQKTSEAILLKNSAIFYQAKSSDQWSFYQAKKIKLHMSENQLMLEKVMRAPKVDLAKLSGLVEKYKKQAKGIRQEAKSFEEKRDELNDESEKALKHHHAFAISVVCFQVSIVLSSMAVMLRRSMLWYVSIGLGALGLVSFSNGYFLFLG